ncbi:Pentatricopeptide repeat-containing protein At2g01390 [Linum grandiflorum]
MLCYIDQYYQQSSTVLTLQCRSRILMKDLLSLINSSLFSEVDSITVYCKFQFETDKQLLRGKCQEAVHIFNTMQDVGVDPDKAACNILIQKCCAVGETKTMVPVLHYMKEHWLVLRYSVFLEALKVV